MWNASFKLTLFGCVISICCVGFASLDGVVVLAVFDCCLYFPSNFSVCGVGLVRNNVDELFVEGTCNVFGVDVCVVFESYGVVVLLWWSFVG